MSCGCIGKRYNGVPVSGGGVAPPATTGWTHAYTLDFRAAHASLGDTDLNSAGASFTYQNVTWQTPSIANTGTNMNVASTTFGLTAAGLRVTGQGGGSIAATGPSFTHIFANLADIAANDASPFDGDPTRMWLLQCYVSATTAAGAGDESGVGLYKITNIPDSPSGESTTFNTYGFNTQAATPSCTAGTGGSPSRLNRNDLAEATSGIDYDCPTIQYTNSGKLVNVWAGSFSDTGDWPVEDTLRSIGNFAATNVFGQNTTGDPFAGFRFVVGMAGGGFDSTIQQARLCFL